LLDVAVVGHELIKNSFLGKLVNFGGVSNLSLVLESLLILNVGANVQEIADNTSVTHPRTDSSLHELSLVLANLSGRVASIASVLLLVSIVRIGGAVVSVSVVVVGVGVARVAVCISSIVAVPIVLGSWSWSSDRDRSQKESGGCKAELHFDRRMVRDWGTKL